MEKYITIGIAGHVDHGKTSLVRTLTGIDTDRLEEEKCRLDDLRDTLGYGRRIGVIVLEHLDSIGFTSRRGEGRVLRETTSQS